MWDSLWEEHRGKTVGVAASLLLGIVYLFFGFWDMLIFGFIVTVGYWIGSKIDKKEEIFSFQEIWQYLWQKWRMFR